MAAGIGQRQRAVGAVTRGTAGAAARAARGAAGVARGAGGVARGAGGDALCRLELNGAPPLAPPPRVSSNRCC
jgi:hypothetical protein